MSRLPSALGARLGPDASKGLDELLDRERREVTEHVLTMAGERFERRLAEETSRLRLDMANVESNLQQAISRSHVDLLKWMMLFWSTGLAAIAGILSYMLRK